MPSGVLLRHLFLVMMSKARVRLATQLLLIFVLVWLGCALVLVAFEAGAHRRVQTVGDAVFYMLASMMTSGEVGIAPQTLPGRMALGFAMFSSKLLTALLCALAAALLIEHKVREDMGLRMHRFQRHVVIVGWNLKGPQIVHTLRSEARWAKVPVVVVAELEAKPSSDPLVFFNRSPYPLRGEAIERSALAEADTVVVLANYGEKTHADALTAVNCMVVRQCNPRATVIAELLDPSQRAYLEMAGANDIVGIGEVGGFLLAEATIGRQSAKDLLAHVQQLRHQQDTASGPKP